MVADCSVSDSSPLGRLVYAKPEDLPSFPSIGLGAKGSAAQRSCIVGLGKQKVTRALETRRFGLRLDGRHHG